MKKIVKFGGSSLANAEQFQKVGAVSYTHLTLPTNLRV